MAKNAGKEDGIPAAPPLLDFGPACHAGGRDGRQKSHIGVVSFRATPSSVYALPVVNASDIFCGRQAVANLVGSIEHLDV